MKRDASWKFFGNGENKTSRSTNKLLKLHETWSANYQKNHLNLGHTRRHIFRQWRRSEFFLEGRNFLALTRPALTHYNLHRHKTLTSATDIITFIP